MVGLEAERERRYVTGENHDRGPLRDDVLRRSGRGQCHKPVDSPRIVMHNA